MAPPVVEGFQATSNQFSQSSTHNCLMPATVQAGWLLVLAVSMSAAGAGTMTTPSGWSVLAAQTDNTVTQAVYGKAADGSEGGTNVNVSTSSGNSHHAAHAYAISQWGGTVATDVVAGTPATGSSANANSPSASWSWGTVDVLALAVAGLWGGSSSATVTVYPSNYTDGSITLGGGTGSSVAHYVTTARRTILGASSPEDPGSFTNTNVAWVANTIVIKQGAAYELEGYRWRNDDGDEDDATWAEDQDTPASVAKETTIRLRMLTDVEGDPPARALKLQYRVAESSDPWRDVGA